MRRSIRRTGVPDRIGSREIADTMKVTRQKIGVPGSNAIQRDLEGAQDVQLCETYSTRARMQADPARGFIWLEADMTRKTDTPEDLSDATLDDLAGGAAHPAPGTDELATEQGEKPPLQATKMPGMVKVSNVTLKRG